MKKLLFLLVEFSSLCLHAQYQLIKPSNYEISLLPSWAKEMYADEPNVFRVDSLISAYYASHPFEKTYHTQYYKRWRRSVANSIDENGFVIQKTSEQIEQENASYLAHQGTVKALNWTVVGPIHNAGEGGAQGSGQTNVYCVDQCEGQPQFLYLGTEPGEVFKSLDGGTSWTCVSMTQNFGGTTAIEVHPMNGQVVFVGGNNGVYRSLDGGVSWQHVVIQTNFEANEILIDPSNDQIVFAASGKGLFRSTDGGTTWIQLYTQKCWDIKAKPGTIGTFYLLKNNPTLIRSEFFVSNDSGATWTIQTNGWYSSTDPARNDGGSRLAVSPADPNRVYAYLIGESKPDDFGYIGVYKSTDGGMSWTLPNGPMGGPYTADHLNLAYGNPSWTYHQGFYNCAIVASPTDADEILVGGLNLYRSSDGGASFSSVAGYVGGPLSMHVDMQDFRSVAGNTWITTDGGVYWSSDFFTTQPEFKMNGVRGSDYWGFGSGWNEDVLVGGLYHNGNLAYHENYGEGNFLELGGGEAPTGYVNPGENRKTYFSDISGKIIPLNYTDPIDNFSFGIAPNESYYAAESSELEFHPNCYSIAYTGKENKLWRTSDGGGSFDLIKQFGAATDDIVTYIEISTQNPNTLYVCQRPASGGLGYLWKTTDGGVNWNQLSIPGGNSRRMLLSINPVNHDQVWIAYADGANGNKMFQSNNGGLSWTNITSSELNNQSIQSLVYVAGTNGAIYVATNNAVYYRNAASSSWALDNGGLPTFTNGNILKPFYRDAKIRLATYGKGIWESPLNEQPSPICRITVDKLIQTVYCVSDSFYFEDHSFLNHQGASWNWTFPTGSPSSSSERNPAVFFSSQGNHLAILTITDQFGQTDQDSLTVTVNNYPAPTVIQEGFEGAFLPDGWFQTNTDGNGQWSLSTTSGGFGLSSQSTIFNNYDYDSQGTTDDLNALLNTEDMTELQLTFEVAYAPWGGSYSDTLDVLISTDCGVTYTSVYSKGGNTLATAPAFTSYYVPASNEWRTETVNLNSFVGFSEALIVFRNKGHWGNVIYLDNVNITNDLGVQKVVPKPVRIFPNPLEAGGKLYVEGVTTDFSLRIRDMNGKTIYCKESGEGEMVIPSSIANGSYMITIETEKTIWNKHLVITNSKK
jgi:photosystem II stability/assembly factor-like uncharacterized protein